MPPLRRDIQLGRSVPAGPRSHMVSVWANSPELQTSKAVFGELWPRPKET